MHLLILKTKAMQIKPRGRCRVKTWVDSGSILNGVRNLLNSTPLPLEGQIETAEGAAGTIKNVIIANELVILRENANQEEDQEIEMIEEIEEGAGLRGEETDLQEEADHQPDDTAMTQENLVAENMTEMIDVIEITIEEIDLEIMTEEKEEDLDRGQDPYLGLQRPLLEENEDREVETPQNQKKNLKITLEGRTVDAREILLLIEMKRTALSKKKEKNPRIRREKREKLKLTVISLR